MVPARAGDSRVAGGLQLFGVVVAALTWIGAFRFGPDSWGFHHWAFMARPLLFAVGGAATLVALPPVASVFARSLERFSRSLEPGRRAPIIAASFIALAIPIFWLGRQTLFLLSDGALLLAAVRQGAPWRMFTADTLGGAVQLLAYRVTLAIAPGASDTASFRIVSIACGVVWLAAVFAITGRVTKNGWGRLLLGGLLLSCGMTRLFYGYIETGPLLAASVAIFLLAALRLVQEGRGIIALALAFIAASALHLTGLLLFPAYLFAVRRWAGADRRRRPAAVVIAILPIVVAGSIWFLLHPSIGKVTSTYAPFFSKFLAFAGPTDGKRPYTLVMPSRWIDFFNEQILIGPFALLALVVAFLLAPRTRVFRRPEGRILLFVLVPFLVLAIAFNRELGGARDWDLLANLALPAILLTALILFEERSRPPPSLVVTLVAVSLFHLVGWVMIDTEPERSMRHFVTLFAPGAPVSPWARSYAFEEAGRARLSQGRFAEAVPLFEAAVRSDPGNVKAIGTLGTLYNSDGRYTAALPLFERAALLRPDLSLNQSNLGSARLHCGRSVEASLSFREAIRLDPTNRSAWIGLSNSTLSSGDAGGADSVAQNGLHRFAHDPELLVARGVALERGGQMDESLLMLEAALRENPDHEAALFNYGRQLIDRRRFLDALGPLERLTARASGDAEAWNNLGVARLQLGRRSEALAAFDRAIQADPTMIQGWVNRAETLAILGRMEEARATLELFRRDHPDAANRAGVDAMLRTLALAPRSP